MSSNTASDRFSILTNGLDSRLKIIRDNKTGFYNITKTAKMILDLNDEVSSDACAGIPAQTNKLTRPRQWLENADTTKLIAECERQTGLSEVWSKSNKGPNDPYAGTYVHRLLYDHFLAWLDVKYAMKISIILDKIHQDTNRKLLQEKDDAIQQLKESVDKQSAKIDQQSAKIDKQSAEIQQLLSYSCTTVTELSGVKDELVDTKNKLTEVKDELVDTNDKLTEVKDELSEARLDIQDGNDKIDNLTDKVEECREVIIDRMDEHTINPRSSTKLQYFACLQHPDYNNVLYAIRSQKSNIKKQLKAHDKWDVMIEPIEDPNSIKMFNRFKDRVKSIESSWKTEIKLQFKKQEIDRESRDAKLRYILDNPLISITRNDIEFDDERITLAQVLKLMRDTTFDRFNLSVP